MKIWIRLAFKEITNNRGFSLLFIVNLSIGLMGFIALNSFNHSLHGYFEDNLKTLVIGHPLYVYSELDSTQTTARHLAENGAKEGTIVLAYSQKRGMGRNGKKWFSPKGGIWFTVILRPSFAPEKANIINIILTTACAETLNHFGVNQPVIKWPNDILIKDKKICGILSQTKSAGQDIEYILVGLGINWDIEFPPELDSSATSFKNETAEEINTNDFLSLLLERIEKYYLALKAKNFSKIQKEWGKFSLPFGLLVKSTASGELYEGQLVGTNENGHLIIRTPYGKLEEIAAGEIEIIT